MHNYASAIILEKVQQDNFYIKDLFLKKIFFSINHISSKLFSHMTYREKSHGEHSTLPNSSFSTLFVPVLDQNI